MSYLKIIFMSIFSPSKTFRKLADSSNSKQFGWMTVIIFALLYTLTVYSFHLKGLIPLLDYFLPVERHQYYYYQSFITFPVTIIGVLINYRTIKYLLKKHNFSLDYKKLWGPVGIASILPSFFILWFVETVLIVTLDWNHFTFDIVRITFGVFWTVILTIKAIQVVEGIDKKQSIFIGFLSSLLMLLWWGLFFR